MNSNTLFHPISDPVIEIFKKMCMSHTLHHCYNFSRGHPFVLLRFNNITVFESEHNKQYLFTRNKATSFGTAVPSSDPP